MARLFILIRRKGSKRFLGAIPTRKGATMASLRRVRIKGFVFRIVTEKQLRRIILKQRPRTARRTIRKIRRLVEREELGNQDQEELGVEEDNSKYPHYNGLTIILILFL